MHRDKSYRKVRDHCHSTGKCIGAARINYSIPKETRVVFHNAPKYKYYFILKELAKVFEGEFNCQRENTETYKTFSVPITKEGKRIDRYEEEITKPCLTNYN